MKRIGLVYRERMVEEIKERYADASACLFVGFNKLNAFSLNLLRNELRKMNTRIVLSKNTMIKRALESLGKDDVDVFLNDSTILVFMYEEDIVKPFKTLVDFSKENEGTLMLKGGYLQEKKLKGDDILDIAKLPSREVLLAKAVSTIASPLTGFLAALNQIPQKLAWVIEEIRKKKSA